MQEYLKCDTVFFCYTGDLGFDLEARLKDCGFSLKKGFSLVNMRYLLKGPMVLVYGKHVNDFFNLKVDVQFIYSYGLLLDLDEFSNYLEIFKNMFFFYKFLLVYVSIFMFMVILFFKR